MKILDEQYQYYLEGDWNDKFPKFYVYSKIQ